MVRSKLGKIKKGKGWINHCKGTDRIEAISDRKEGLIKKKEKKFGNHVG